MNQDVNDLNDYVNGKTNYTPLLNTFFGKSREKDYFVEIGKYLYKDVYKGNLPTEFGFYEKRIKKNSSIIKKMNIFSNELKNAYSGIAIMFLTAIINENSLKKMFGDPIRHSEFGEGFYGQSGRGRRVGRHTYCSYFVVINGTGFHIGYDHRGTSIESNEDNPDILLESIKKMILMYKKKAI